jgi:integrase/recombinase XerC
VRANPCEGVRSPKSPKHLPNALSVDETARLLQPSDDGDPVLLARDMAMFELFYSSGLRLAELAALDCAALDSALNEGEVRVLGKRNKARLVPVGRKAREALVAWAALRDSLAGAEEPALFVSRRGGRISHRMIQLRWRSLPCNSGLPRHVHPHMLRHSFASHVCNPPAICARCRKCSATPVLPRRRSTRISISSIWPKSTMRRIRGPSARRLLRSTAKNARKSSFN